jgi:hypothetical protein
MIWAGDSGGTNYKSDGSDFQEPLSVSAYSDGFRTAVPIESVHPFRGFSYTSAGVGFVTFA